MPENVLSNKLASYQDTGYVIAPAGYGKTHLIALSVKASTSKQLVLTHTFAGVNSIKSKMVKLGVSSKKYNVETIASWSLMLCLSFPQTSGWVVENPKGDDWKTLYVKCGNLLKYSFISDIIKATYSGVYVDEYQDCSKIQHSLVLAISAILPCKLLGDPLQAIFDFNDSPVDWETDIYPAIPSLGELTNPWRWKKSGNDDLGCWLDITRTKIIQNKTIDLSSNFPDSVKVVQCDFNDWKNQDRLTPFYNHLQYNGSVVVISSGDPRAKNKNHNLSRSLGGRYSSIEEIEGTAIFSFIKKLACLDNPQKRLLHAIEFAAKTMCGVKTILTVGTKRGEKSNCTKATKSPRVLLAANAYFEHSDSKTLLELLIVIKEAAGTSLYRRDLFNRMKNVLILHSNNEQLSLEEAACRYQTEFRHAGRPLTFKKIIGTTLLVKGLEYDHSIIINPQLLGSKELYVALTRASKTVTLITKNLQLNPSLIV